ncbi:MAG: DNA polymerase III subunit alpha [Spirochaetales bacterium]|nr:DNA polymerase III subunit alpha [Spirochaetales bacterium]
MFWDSSFHIPIHLRSNYSLLGGCLSPEEICRYASTKGFPAVGMVDRNNMYGLPRFLAAAGRFGIKPVAGVAVRTGGGDLFTAYIMNRKGFSRIAGIITALLYEESPFRKDERKSSHDPVADLLEHGWDGLSIVSDNFSLLKRLAGRERRGLFVKLTWGRGYIGLLRAARAMSLPVIGINDGVVLDRNDVWFFNLLRAIDLNTTIGRLPEGEKLLSHQRIATTDEMEAFFSAVPEALRNAAVLADESAAEEIVGKGYVFPRFRDLDENGAFSLLRRLCMAGVGRRYGSIRPDIEKRLNYELSIIRRKHFAAYFLVVHDIVSRCPRTCGRGSSAASIVSYLLGITHIDPLKYNLFFERFLNMGRKDPPDIDVDFPWDERDIVLKYVFDTYRGRSGMVANHVTFGRRSCIREPAKALGIPEEEIGRLVSLWREEKRDGLPPYLKKVSERIFGFPHYIGVHCGGVVVTPEPITGYTHLQPSIAGYPVIAWEKEGTEDAGLVKIDLLGNRSLAVLRDTIEFIGERYGRKIEWDRFNPLDNKKARQLIGNGNTTGIFYIESPATRQLLKKMKRGDFEHIVIASSIIRPAANMYIREYVRRLGTGTYTPLHPLIGETLKETLGIMVYQEDVSRVAIDLAGFSVEEADALRKIIAKKDREHRLADFREHFVMGGRARGVSEEVLVTVWNMILSFKGYSFCKPHSASYALVSYKLAYLKAYYPLEFMTSVINNGGGYYSRQTYLNEIRRMGFAVLGPDVTASRYDYSIEDRRENGEVRAALRVGLGQLVELSREFVESIIREREMKPFRGFQDFLRRTHPGLPEMRILIRSGALDRLGEKLSRPAMFWLYFNTEKSDGFFLIPPVPDFIGDYPAGIKLRDEIATLGLIISHHPLAVFRKRIACRLTKKSIFPFISSREIPAFINRQVCIAGLIVTGKEVVTKADETMIFVSFEDPYSMFETVFFPPVFRRFFPLLEEVGIYLITGKVEEDQGAISINVDAIEKLSRS